MLHLPTRVHNPNGIWIGSAIFAQLTAECPYTLQWAALFTSKLPLPMEASGPLGPYKHRSQHGISIGSAVFAGLPSVTDKPTETTLLGR